MINKFLKTGLKQLVLLSFIAFIITLILLNTQVKASEDSSSVKDESEISQELLLFEEMPIVISAARQPQPINLLSVPVNVITAEDIHYSGATTITDVLKFAPSIDFVQLSRNRHAFGVHGFHDMLSDRTLYLLNGYNAAQPTFGGAEYYALPIFLEDIKSIEIVRGPGGAAWGANASTGVVNIITKKPNEIKRSLSTSTVNTFGDLTSQLRLTDTKENLSWRLSLGLHKLKSSDHILNDNISFLPWRMPVPYINPDSSNFPVGIDEMVARDFSSTKIFDSEIVYTLSNNTNLSCGLGILDRKQGDSEFGGNFSFGNEEFKTNRLHMKADKQINKDSSVSVKWLWRYQDVNRPTFSVYNVNENDLEAQINLKPREDHNFSAGLNGRFTSIETTLMEPQVYSLRNGSISEKWAGIFLIDRWNTTEHLVLEAQIRIDDYSATKADWSGRTSALYALDNENNNVIRLSSARSFRAPLSFIREGEGHMLELKPGVFGIDFAGKPDIGHEEVWSFETGYIMKLYDNFKFMTNLYYHRYHDLIGVDMNLLPSGTADIKFDNIDGATGKGIDFEISILKPWKYFSKLSLWYCYYDLERDKKYQSIRAFLPVKHKAGTTIRFTPIFKWVLNTNYKYIDTTKDDLTDDTISIQNYLDITATRKFSWNGELTIGANDIINKKHEAFRGFGEFTAHQTPGRNFFIRLQIYF